MHSNKCPRGFKWCDQRQECIPERNGEKVHQVKGRYFFKGDGYMDKNTQYASEVVDMAFDEGFEVFTKLKIAEKKIERLLDMCGKHHTSECGTMEDDAPGDSQDEYIEEPPITGPNKIDHVPNQHFGTLYSSLRKQIGELRKLTKEGKDEYRAFFKKMLNKFGVNSPAELDDEKKKAFFNAVDKGWKAKNEGWIGEGLINSAKCKTAKYAVWDNKLGLKNRMELLYICQHSKGDKSCIKDKEAVKKIQDQIKMWEEKVKRYCK